MTPVEKAREMVDKIQDGLWRDRAVRIYREDAVYTALIAIDEIYLNCTDQSKNDYWIEVKNELENL